MTTYRTTEMFSDPRFALFAVESVEFEHATTTSGGYMRGVIEPLAVIVRSPDATTALDMLGNPVSIEQLRQKVPGPLHCE